MENRSKDDRMIMSLVTTFDRSSALARSLPQIAALGWPVLCVDDASDQLHAEYVSKLCDEYGAARLRLPSNRGLAAAMNIGLSYLLADPAVKWVSYLQDDVDLAPDAKEVIESAVREYGASWPLMTGHDAGEHVAERGLSPMFHGRWPSLKTNTRATHLLASREYWLSVMPIPTRRLGAPLPFNRLTPDEQRHHRKRGELRGMGSEVDHWITHRAPDSIVARGAHVLCIPGLVRTFLHGAADSCWGNEQRAGADPEFGEARR